MRYKVIGSILVIGVLVIIGFFMGAFDSTPAAYTSSGTSSHDDSFRNVGH